VARPILKRKDIERGFLEVVARKGLRGTTIQDIAETASVSPGLLYRYWKNRDQLAGDVYRKHFIALMDRLAGVAARERTAAEKLRALVADFMGFADEQPMMLRFLLLSQHDLANEVSEEHGVRALATHIVQQGMEQGLIRRMDPDLALQILLGIVVQPALGAVYGNLKLPASSHCEAIVGALYRALGPDGCEAGTAAGGK
jgi:AcrR family transcriptional regulator